MTDTVKCWLLSKIENLLVFAIFMCIISLSAPVWFIDGYDLMTETQQKETNDIVYTNNSSL